MHDHVVLQSTNEEQINLHKMKRISIIFLSNLCWLLSLGQIKDIVQTDGYTNAVHKTHAGKIVFTAGYIALDKIKETDFLSNFALKKDPDLDIRVFLDNSITNYLHQLAPDLSAEELIVKGNYQFSFFVDDHFIYKENLHYGAGLKKNTTTTFRVPIVDSKDGDWWSIYLFERFQLNGGEKALTDGMHQLKIEMRPYLKMNENAELKLGEIIVKGQINLIVKTPKLTAKQIVVQPIQPNSGWPISKAGYDKKIIEALNKSIVLNEFKKITSIVVIKNGKLLIEEYFNQANRNTMHDTRSVGKSFTSALMGIAIKQGYIKSEKQSLKTFYDLQQFANYSSKKDSISIQDLLKMSTAFNGSDNHDDSPGNEENMYPTENWVKFALDLPMDSTKNNGKQWDYFTAGVILLGDIINKSVPDGLEKFADKKLFHPLGITNYQWQYTPQKVANTAGGLQMSALSFAKFGQLYQNKGLWNGQQILPTKWVDETFTKQLQIPERENEFYGYLFWNKTYTINGKNYETFYCAGNGGSKIYVFKDIPLTIVITAKAYNKPYAHPQVDKMMEVYILPAVLK
jgi:CubicO group peptidase (beta-lactamase class C family)